MRPTSFLLYACQCYGGTERWLAQSGDCGNGIQHFQLGLGWANLGFYLLRCVGQVDRSGLVAGAHFCLIALQRGEENGVEQNWFRESEPWSHVTCHAKVGILIDGTRDQTADRLLACHSVAEYCGEDLSEARRRLDCRESNLADGIAFGESENTTDLIERDQTLDLADCLVKFWALTAGERN